MGAGVQRRAKTAWPAPSTRVAQRAQKIRVVTPEMLAERKKIAEEEAQWNMHKARTTLSELEVLMKAKRTEEGMDIIRLLGPGNPRSRFMILFALSDYSYRQFDELCVSQKVNMDKIYEDARVLSHSKTKLRSLGQKVLMHLSQAGQTDAVIYVANQALRQDRLGSMEAKTALSWLSKIAERGSHRALVMQGKLAAYRGNEEDAISFYEQAMQGAMTFALEKVDPRIRPFIAAQQMDELSSPWIELGQLYMKRGMNEYASAAYQIGMDVDDPLAYYCRAVLDRFVDGEYTLDWLNHMTRAAASGSVQGAHELAVYYADIKAPDMSIEQQKEAGSSFLDKTLDTLRALLRPAAVESDPKQNILHYAGFAQTPEERVRLAQNWLDVAAGYGYGPAFIDLAQLHLQKYIFPSDNLRPILAPLQYQTIDSGPPGGVANPCFDPEMAQLRMADFWTLAEDETEHDPLHGQRTFPEVFELWETRVPELFEEVREMADTMGIDIASSRGRNIGKLLYRHQGDRSTSLLPYGDE